MASPENNQTTTSLPPGDSDPNLIYIAVGKSIHRWENLEQALARLYLKFAGIPEIPPNYTSFGQENGTYAKRMAALMTAAETYFAKHPHQHKEGAFQDIVKRADDLSIERHRIAHGHITMWGEFKIPQMEKGTHFTAETTILYRWAPPFYGVRKLRTNPVGDNGERIDTISQQFEALHNQVFAFTEAL